MNDGGSTIRHMGLAVAGPRLSYCIIEPPELLIDWGIKHKLARDMTHIGLLFSDLCKYYQPQQLFLEDTTCKFCRLGKPNVNLLRQISALAQLHNVRVCPRSWPEVKAALHLNNSDTLEQVSQQLAKRFPVIACRVPPKRLPWLPEHRNMVLFKAAGLAVSM